MNDVKSIPITNNGDDLNKFGNMMIKLGYHLNILNNSFKYLINCK